MGRLEKKLFFVAKDTHKGRSGAARKTWEVLRAGGVAMGRDALVEDGVSLLGEYEYRVKGMGRLDAPVREPAYAEVVETLKHIPVVVVAASEGECF